MSPAKKERMPCLICGKEPYRAYYKYCSNACQMEYQYRAYIQRWIKGEVVGLQTIGTVNAYIKKYLRKKFEDKCCLCGWAQTNPKTGTVPLVADHVDGDWRNNTEMNLRLLCPNCDSLTPTYAGLNRGNGRKNRVVSQRVHGARALDRKGKIR